MTGEREFSKASFYHFLNEGRLMASRCPHGSLYVPPRPMCPEDLHGQMEWVELSGRGRLAAYSIIYIGPSEMIAAGYDRKNPYCAGVVELEEGPKISAQILDVDVTHPETIRIGTPLEAAYIQRGQGDASQTYLAFRPVQQ
ncbi:MAG TPA: Zn-ribbon domain-containing OB-fold protein [Anaerolineaceae bacterium]|nr:Zn-ribbon domain-containing OB-fold protein [Anaerolineaceae bacterium]